MMAFDILKTGHVGVDGSVGRSSAAAWTLEELFRPFEQRSADRSGLGLSISKRGVEANGGVLRVRDMPGHGCVFTIDLPRLAQV